MKETFKARKGGLTVRGEKSSKPKQPPKQETKEEVKTDVAARPS
jgi:hypothetical protein